MEVVDGVVVEVVDVLEVELVVDGLVLDVVDEVELVLDDVVLDVVVDAGRSSSADGAGKSSGSRSSRATDMKRCQIWAERPPPLMPSMGVAASGNPTHTSAA